MCIYHFKTGTTDTNGFRLIKLVVIIIAQEKAKFFWDLTDLRKYDNIIIMILLKAVGRRVFCYERSATK
jgi:hypothetical protein